MAAPGVAGRIRKLALRRPNRQDLRGEQPAVLDPIPVAARPDASLLGSVWKQCFPGGAKPTGSLPRDNGAGAKNVRSA